MVWYLVPRCDGCLRWCVRLTCTFTTLPLPPGLRPTPHVYGSVIAACLRAEDLSRAFSVLEHITNDGLQLSTRVVVCRDGVLKTMGQTCLTVPVLLDSTPHFHPLDCWPKQPWHVQTRVGSVRSHAPGSG